MKSGESWLGLKMETLGLRQGGGMNNIKRITTGDSRISYDYSHSHTAHGCSNSWISDTTIRRRVSVSFANWGYNTLVLIFLILLASEIVQSSPLLGGGANGNLSKKCEVLDETNVVPGVSCDFERPCAWKWRAPANGETGFRNMSAAQVIARIQKLGEWAFRGPLIDTDKKTNGKYLSIVNSIIFQQIFMY